MQIHISMNAVWEMEYKYKSILLLDIISSILGYFIFCSILFLVFIPNILCIFVYYTNSVYRTFLYSVYCTFKFLASA